MGPTSAERVGCLIVGQNRSGVISGWSWRITTCSIAIELVGGGDTDAARILVLDSNIAESDGFTLGIVDSMAFVETGDPGHVRRIYRAVLSCTNPQSGVPSVALRCDLHAAQTPPCGVLHRTVPLRAVG